MTTVFLLTANKKRSFHSTMNVSSKAVNVTTGSFPILAHVHDFVWKKKPLYIAVVFSRVRRSSFLKYYELNVEKA